MHNPSDGLRLLLLSSSLCLLLGCASTKIGEPVISSSLDDLPRPTELLVYPFDVDENEVLADSFGPGLLTGDGEPSSRVELAENVQRGFQFAFVMALRDKGIKARRATPSTKPRRDSLQVLGEFVTIDEGDMMGRTVR